MQKMSLIVLLAACALLTSCNLVKGVGKSASGAQGELKPPPAAVVIGEPLAWRELASLPSEVSLDHPRPGMVVGEFSKDKNDDILLLDWTGDTEVIHTNGKRANVKGEIWGAVFPFIAWDYNRNGICELVPTNIGYIWEKQAEGSIDWYGSEMEYFSTDPDFRTSGKLKLAERGKWTPVFDYKGRLMIQLSSGDEDGVIVCGDYDGDGWNDLAVEMEGVAEQVQVYGGIGQRLGTWMMRMKPVYAMAGDTDGDGKEEFLCLEGSRIGVYRVKQDRTDLQGWPLGECPSAAADINGDGKVEILGAVCELESPEGKDNASEARQIMNQYLIELSDARISEEDAAQREQQLSPEEMEAANAAILAKIEKVTAKFIELIAPYTTPHGGYFDAAAGTFTAFQFPKEAAYPFNMFYAKHGEIVCADLDRDGDREIIAKASTGCALFIFNLQGECEYYEEFGKPATTMDVAHTKDGDVLVVLAGDRILAYP